MRMPTRGSPDSTVPDEPGGSEGPTLDFQSISPTGSTSSCFPYALQLVLLSAGCGSFVFGLNLCLLNTSVATIGSDFDWCGYEGVRDCVAARNYTAFIRTVVYLGGAVGSVTGGHLLPLGRRTGLQLSAGIFAFGIITSCTANGFPALLWGRLVVGYACGLVSFVSPMYIAEMSPNKMRGTYGIMHQLATHAGVFVAVVLGLPFSSPPETEDRYMWTLPVFDKIWWRVMFGLGIIPAAVGAFLLSKVYVFETPHYYVENGRSKDAEALLKVLHGKDDVLEELNDIEEGLRTARAAKENGLSCTTAMRDEEYRRVILVGCALASLQQLSGITAFVTSSNSLFEDAGLSGIMITVMSTVVTFVLVVMTFPSLFLVESMGRRQLMLMGTCGQMAAVLPAAVMLWTGGEEDPVAQWMCIAAAFAFIVFFALALGPVTWVFVFEIYPAEVKGVATGTATMCNWVSGMLIVFTLQYLSIASAYTLFVGINAILVVVIIFFVKETKGRSIDDSPYFAKKPIEGKEIPLP